MSSKKREKFLESIKQKNEAEKKPIFIQVPENVESIDYGNVFLNAKVQTEEYIRKQKEEQEK